MLTLKVRRIGRDIPFNLLVGSPFVTVVLFCGFIVDDWGQLGNGLSLSEQIKGWEALWGYRPISWITIPTIVHLLRDNYTLIALVHLLFLTYGFSEIVKWKHIGLTFSQRRFALLLLFSPAISSTVVFSVINQLSASLSIVFFAIGIRIDRKSNPYILREILMGIAFLCSLLCYEITLPLILTHFLFSFFEAKRNVRSIVSPVLVLAFLILWQKVIAPIAFDSNLSRFASVSPLAAGTYLYTMLISFPLNLLATIFDSLLLVIIALSLFLVAIRFFTLGEVNERLEVDREKTFIIVLGLFANSLLFFFSAAPSKLNGYENRGMTSAWILLSLLIASRFTWRRTFHTTVLLVFAATNFVFFALKIHEAARATKDRQHVLSQIADSGIIKSDGVVSLILDIPCFVDGSKFRTNVFCTAWDANGALSAQSMKFNSVYVVEDFGFFGLETPVFDDSELFVVAFDKDFDLTGIEQIEAYKQKSVVTDLRRKGKASREGEGMQLCKEIVSNAINLQFSVRTTDLVKCMKDPFNQ